MNIRHVIFDFSGTLFDDHSISFIPTKQTIKYFSGISISKLDYKNHFTIPVDKFYKRYIQNVSFKKIDDYYFKEFEKYISKGKLFSGVLDTIKYLHRKKISMSIFSTVKQELLDEACKNLKITKYFKKIEGSIIDKKKDLKKHLQSVNKKPSETLFIGDTDHDIEAANHHKAMSGCILNGYQTQHKLLKQKPRFTWRDQTEWLYFFKTLYEKKKKKRAKSHPVSTVGALIFNQKQEILLILTHKWSYTYGIPGGKIEMGENSQKAVIREIYEETNLKINPSPLYICQDSINSKEFYIPNSHFLLLNYLATIKTKTNQVKLNDEAISYLWVPPKEALNLQLNQPTKKLIEFYLDSK